MHCIGRIASVTVAPTAAPGAKRSRGRSATRPVRTRASSDNASGDDEDRKAPTVMPRRRLINLAAATTAMVVSNKANAGSNEFAGDAAMAVMNRVGKVKMADDEWKTKLKDEPYAYEVLRRSEERV